MIMSGDKKKAVTLIIRRIKGGDGYEQMKGHNQEMMESPKNELGDEIDNSSGLMAASQDIIDAIQHKDPKMLKSALKAFMELCDYQEEDED